MLLETEITHLRLSAAWGVMIRARTKRILTDEENRAVWKTADEMAELRATQAGEVFFGLVGASSVKLYALIEPALVKKLAFGRSSPCPELLAEMQGRAQDPST